MHEVKIIGAVVCGLLLLGAALQDAFEVMLLPRRIERRIRLMRVIFKFGWAAWSRLARYAPDGPGREQFLSLFGALAMLFLFLTWVISLVLGYGCLLWAVEASLPGGPELSFPDAVYLSAGSFFTVGAAGVTPHTGAARSLAVIVAGTGLGFIAVVIGYLPVLYQLFSRREAHIIQLDARAGSPPSAVTLITRHAESGDIAGINALLRSWEIWASELLESHLSYPMLAYYRSQHDNQSWLAAMTAVMDTCSLVLIGLEEVDPLQARMTFSMARQVVIEMARSFQIPPSRYDGGDRLGTDRYLQMEHAFAEAGVSWGGGPQSEQLLGALRATYEPLLDGLATHLLLPLPGFLADAEGTDHWERGPRGIIARRLIEDLAGRSVEPGDDAMDLDDRLWRRVRTRLR